MKISEVVKKLNSIKKDHGDLDVVAYYEPESWFESVFVSLSEIKRTNEDTGKVSKRKYKVVKILSEGDSDIQGLL
jgi:hypothetical protein